MEIKVLQLHKRASVEYKNIQDKYNFSIANKCIALSDGTTQSFKSELWANMLVDNFVKAPLFDIKLLIDEFKKLGAKFNNSEFEFSSNFAIAAIEKNKKNKGGTATFIGVQIINESLLKIINCGDTCLFILKNNDVIKFPFNNVEELDGNNYFINSSKVLNNEIEPEFFNQNEIIVSEEDIIILATDAISRLILRKPESIPLILNCSNFEEFKNFCELHWDNKELEEDDISVIIISTAKQDKISEIVPPKEFSFPPIEEKEFVSFYDNTNSNNQLDIQEMEQLNRMIQQLFRETNYLKNKLKLTQALLISALALLLLNTFLMFYFINKNKASKQEIESNNEISTQYEEINNNLEQETKVLDLDEDVNVITETIDEKKETNNDRKVITEKDISIKKNKVDSEITKNEKEKISTNQKLEDSENRTTNKTEVKKDTVKK